MSTRWDCSRSSFRSCQSGLIFAGARHLRSAAEQIEYWATLGRKVAGVLDPVRLLDVLSSPATLKVVTTVGVLVDPEQVFGSLETGRRSGRQVLTVARASVCYRAAPEKPGWLEQISPNGTRTLGRFENGMFEPQANQQTHAVE